MIDLDELRDAAQKAFPRDRLMPAREESWRKVVDLGWLMIELDEADGGLGLGPMASAAIVFEQGRVLSCAPLIPALLGLRAIAGSPALAARPDWIERICSGEYVPANLLPAAVQRDGTGAWSGVIGGVFEADMAQHVIAVLPDTVLLVPVAAPGVQVRERPLWDESRRMFDIELAGFVPDPAHLLAQGEAARALDEQIACAAQLTLAADALGGANALLDLTVDYLNLRKQFDRPLAMFQALKHRIADCKIQIAAAEALLWSRGAQAELALVDAGALKAMASEVYARVAEEAIQLHGGIGLTQEYPCHRYLKRAFLDRTLCGSVDHWQEQAGRAALQRLAY